MLASCCSRDKVFARIARRDRSDLFGTESDLSECREDLRDLIRTDFDHDDVSRSGGIPAFLHGEGLWSPVQHLSNRFDLTLRNMPRQLCNDSNRRRELVAPLLT